MKKFVFTLITIIYTLSSFLCDIPVFANEKKNDEIITETKVYTPISEYYLLADVSSNLFMCEKNSDKEIEPSGFAKILTAITVLEYEEDIYRKVTVAKDIFEGYNYANRSIGLKYGEEISIYDLIRAMLVYDAGDCAIALAHCVTESYDDFIALMNKTAKKAGATASEFLHPAGFKKSGQKTTLSDLFYITKYALKNDTFSKIVNMDYIEIAPTNMHEQKRRLFNTNNFLTTYYSPDYYNPDVYGVKSYYNSEENSGVIAKYSDASTTLLALCAKAKTIDGSDMAYKDAQHLIEYAKENYTPVTIIDNDQFMSEVKLINGKGINNLLLVNDGKIKTMLPKNYDKNLIEIKTETNKNILAPIKKGDVLGKAIINYDGKKCGEVNLLAYSDVQKSTWVYVKNKISNFFDSATFKLIIFFTIVILALIAFEKIRKSKYKAKRKK